MNNHEKFLKAIHEKKILQVKIKSHEKGLISRKCIPFDYGPGKIDKWSRKRYHFYDLNSPKKPHILSITPNQLIKIEILDENFDPKNYINWQTKWFIPRAWGEFS